MTIIAGLLLVALLVLAIMFWAICSVAISRGYNRDAERSRADEFQRQLDAQADELAEARRLKVHLTDDIAGPKRCRVIRDNVVVFDGRDWSDAVTRTFVSPPANVEERPSDAWWTKSLGGVFL